MNREKRTLVPTELGLKVFDFLIANLEALFDVQFTAGMEEQLDAIEEGQVGWQDMLTTFNEKFQEWLKTARGPAGDRQAVVKMLDALESVKEWQAPMTRGSKTLYSDEKFVASLRRQCAENKRVISARQQEAVSKLIFRYQDQIPNAAALIAELKLQPPETDAERAKPPREETIQKLAMLESVAFEPPRQFGKKFMTTRSFALRFALRSIKASGFRPRKLAISTKSCASMRNKSRTSRVKWKRWASRLNRRRHRKGS